MGKYRGIDDSEAWVPRRFAALDKAIGDLRAARKPQFIWPRITCMSTVGQAIATGGSITTVTFDTISEQIPDWGGSTPLGRVSAPASGIYSISAGFRWDSATSGRRHAEINVNGTAIAVSEFAVTVAGNPGHALAVETRLSIGDAVALGAYQNSGASLSIGTMAPKTYLTVRQVA